MTAARALEQTARALVTLGVLLVGVVLLITVGVPLMQKGMVDAIPKIFPTPTASPHSVVTPPKKSPAHPTPVVVPR